MKSFIAVLLCTFVVGVLSGGPMHEKIVKCKEELGVEEDAIRNMMKNNDYNDPTVRCFNACLMKSFGKMAEDGTVNKDAVSEHVPPHVDREQFIEAATVCMEEKGTDECDTANLIHKCLKDKKVIPSGLPPPPPQ
uniref:Odorant-binding protein 9 n=1 Tax=Aulacocentrum confusum TaxID=2767324 RepID=A0A7G8Z910_9HYME|nr:odorant-binding protein 9 [Aulacocentrum confusum]